MNHGFSWLADIFYNRSLIIQSLFYCLLGTSLHKSHESRNLAQGVKPQNSEREKFGKTLRDAWELREARNPLQASSIISVWGEEWEGESYRSWGHYITPHSMHHANIYCMSLWVPGIALGTGKSCNLCRQNTALINLTFQWEVDDNKQIRSRKISDRGTCYENETK